MGERQTDRDSEAFGPKNNTFSERGGVGEEGWVGGGVFLTGRLDILKQRQRERPQFRVSSEERFVESAQNMTREKSQL